MADTHSRVDQGPTTTATQIGSELGSYNSPLAPYAATIYQLGVQYGVDPSFFMGVCYGENAYGTVGAARQSYNWTSVSQGLYGGSATPCYDTSCRFGSYPTPQAGIEAFYRLITAEYYPLGQRDLYSIWWGVGGTSTTTGTHAYAPAFENPPSSLDTVVTVMNRLASGPGTAVGTSGQPANPVPVPSGAATASAGSTPTWAWLVAAAFVAAMV